MSMTRAQMRTELQATGFNNTTADVVRQNLWLDAAYLWVWNARKPTGAPIRWSFEKVDQADLAVVAGDSTPTMPSDIGTVDWIEDNYGGKLRELSPEEFDTTFAGDTVAGVTGNPVAFKVVNRQVTFGPTPNTTATFKLSYTRRVAHLNSGGTTVGGTFTDDGDTPLWADHHLIVVWHAALLGHASASNPFSVTFQGLRDDALQAMRADLEAQQAPGQTWGAGGQNRPGFTLI